MTPNNKFFNSFLSAFFALSLLIIPVEKILSQSMPLAEKQMIEEKKEKLLTQEEKESVKAKLLKVKERTKFAYYNEDGSFSSQKVLLEKVYFDEKGNRTEHIILKADSLLDRRFTYNYDSLGNAIKSEVYNEYDNIIFKRESVYNEKSKEISRKYWEAKSKGESYAELKYNEQKLLSELIAYRPNGKIASIVKMIYDNGRLAGIETLNENGKIIDKSVLIYDGSGNITSEVFTTQKDTATFKYTYNSDDYLIKTEYPDATRYMEYDANGNLIEDKQIYYTGEREFKVRFSYYDNGLIKEEIRFSADDKPSFYSVFEYEFYK